MASTDIGSNLNHLTTTNFPILKKIKIGTYKSVRKLRKALKAKGICMVSSKYTLPATPLAESESEVTVHVATVKELTGMAVATIGEIKEAICSKGYELCPAEVGPQLRLQYSDQPRNRNLFVAMDPLVDLDDFKLTMFVLGHPFYGLSLGGCNNYPGIDYAGEYHFLFISRSE